MTPEEAYEEALRRIRKAKETGALELDLSGLKTLNLLPGEMDQLISIQSLNLSGCLCLDLGVDLYSLEDLASLRSLNLSGCRLDLYDLYQLGNLVSLQSLNLSECDFRGDFSDDLSPLAGLTSLQSLDLSGCNQLSDIRPLAGLTSLRSLNLSDCRSLGYLVPLSYLTFLQSLNLSGCRYFDGDLYQLTGLTSLRSLDFSDCHHLSGDLHPLADFTSLQSLNFGNCWRLSVSLYALASLTSLQALNLSGCSELSGDLSPLAGLTSLQALNLSGCSELNGDLSPLAGLTSLQALNLSGCSELNGDLTPLAGLTSLQMLDLAECKLRRLDKLAGLTSLESLDLSWGGRFTPSLNALTSKRHYLWGSLDIRQFGSIKSLLPRLKSLRLFGCDLDDLPPEVCGEEWGENVLDKVRAHYEDLKSGPRIDAEVKVLFLGNGGVGKTQLCRHLRDLEFDPISPSTHGVELAQTTVELNGFLNPARLNLLDFGGQDIYHGSHALFLHGQAIFLVLWTPELERTSSYEENGVPLRHRPLSYWLDYIRNFAGTEASVIIVQSQCDTRDQRKLHPPAPVDDFPFHRSIEVSARTGRNLGILKEYIKEAVRDRFDRRPPPPIGEGRLKMRDRLRQMLEEDQKREPAHRQHRLLQQEEFDRICAETGGVSDSTALLDFLHHKGVLFYRTGLFGDRIVLDQNWALEAIYAIFDRKRILPLLRGYGRFCRADLEALIWSGYTPDEQKVFLGMMESCGICFRVRELPHQEQLDKEWEYIAPELLPEWSEAQKSLLAGRIPKDHPMAEAEARYTFFHEGVLRGYLSRIGTQAGDAAIYWKYGCWFYEETTDSRVLIEGLWDDAESEAGAGTIRFRAWGKKARQLIDSLLVELQLLRVGQPPKIIWQGNELDGPSKNGLNSMMITEPPQSLATPPQVFVSYAWGDTSPSALEEDRQRQELVERLCRSLDKDAWNVIRDKEALHPGDLISAFMTKLGQADRVIVVLSAKYLRSTACMTELYDIYRNTLQNKEYFLQRVIPLILKDANIGSWRGRATYAEHWETEFKAMEQHFTHLGVEDLKLYKAMRRWHNEVGDMLAYVNDVLAPRGFEEIVKDNFAGLRQMLQQREPSEARSAGATSPDQIGGLHEKSFEIGNQSLSHDVCIICAMREEGEAAVKVFSERFGVEFKSRFALSNRQYNYATITNDAKEHLSCGE